MHDTLIDEKCRKQVAYMVYKMHLPLNMREDAFQAGMLGCVLAEASGQYDPAYGGFPNFTKRSAYWEILRYCRGADCLTPPQRRQVRDGLADEPEHCDVRDVARTLQSNTLGPEQLAAAGEAAARLEQLVDALPPRQRTVIRGLYWDGRTQTDIAAQLGVSKSLCCRDAHQAIERLRADYAPKSGFQANEIT